MMKNWILLSLLLFAALSCKKDDSKIGIYITGTILDPNSGEIVENVRVIIAHKSVENGAYNSNYINLDTATSDAFGKYQLEIKRENTLGYELSYEKEGYFPVKIEKNIDEIETKGETVINIDFYTKSSILFHFKNIGSANSGDLFTFNKRTGITSCKECCSNGTKEYPGANVDVKYNCAAQGGSFMVYEYTASSDNGYLFVRDSVFCPVQDTAFVLIEY